MSFPPSQPTYFSSYPQSAGMQYSAALTNALEQQQQQQLLASTYYYPTSESYKQVSTNCNLLSTPGLPLSQRRRLRSEREKFLLFVKILFRYLERSGCNENVYHQAKRIVAECARRNRMGDINYMPLRDAVEERLKDVLGADFYVRIQLYCDYYCETKGLNPATSI